jgi:hypothetical protein
LMTFDTLDGIYDVLNTPGPQLVGLTPSVAEALREFTPLLDETRTLITLRTDVDLPFAEALQPRVATVTPMTEPEAAAVIVQTLDAIVDEATPTPGPAAEAGQLAKWVHESRQFSAYGTPQAVLATVLAGRELGLQAMASLRSIHIVEGKPTLSADLIRALAMQHPDCRYFRCTERVTTPGEERATFVTKRGDDPEMSLTYTIAEAKAAGLVRNGSGWAKNPADMAVARASAKLARLVYPEATFGLYLREELEEGRAA